MQTFFSILNSRTSKQVLVTSWIVTTAIALVLYGFFRLLFIDFRISVTEDLYNLLSLSGTAALISVCIFAVYLFTEFADYRLKQPLKWKWSYVSVPVVIIVVSLVLASCGSSPVTGFKKNLNTGMVTNYKGLTTENATLIMNNEELNHTDIPLGEAFVLLNSGVNGFTLKDNKAKVGCALKISDKKGNILLNEPDLFKGNDSFSSKDAANLRCTISTGAPMESEEHYDVEVVFSDKQGTGTIENKFTIRAIDMP